MAWAQGTDIVRDALQDLEFRGQVQERGPVLARVVGMACVCIEAVEGAVAGRFGLERGAEEGGVCRSTWDSAGAVCFDVDLEEDEGWVRLRGEGCKEGDLGRVV